VNQAETIVVKIGGSTLGQHDTTLTDIAALQRAGRRLVVVHGGGAEISRWLAIHQVPSHFVDGLRVTDAEARDVVVAVLAGLVNKQLVAQFARLGVRALGLCGADAGLFAARIGNPALGFVGTEGAVDRAPLDALTAAGLLPLIAPIGLAETESGSELVNVNGDTMAGEVAAALGRCRLVFLTDVAGVLDADGVLVETLDAAARAHLRQAGALKGGMLPKIDACVLAAKAGASAVIVDGRIAGALAGALDERPRGTLVVA
jgi:acetylglutamate kinase